MSDMTASVLLVLLCFVVYFLPYLIAVKHKHHQKLAIDWLNLLLGWTVLGWVIALIWSLTAVEPKRMTLSRSET